MAAGRYIPRPKPSAPKRQEHTTPRPDLPYMHTSRNGSKAAAAIPTEVWTRIFHWSQLLSLQSDISDSDDVNSDRFPSHRLLSDDLSPPSIPSQTPLVIAHVCRYWREIMFKDPTFWDKVHICVSTSSSAMECETKIELLEEWVARSNQLPLSLTVVQEGLADAALSGGGARPAAPPPVHGTVCDFIRTHSARWRKIDITFSPNTASHYRSEVLHLGNFPTLKTLTLRAAEVGRNSFRPPRVAIGAPKLSKMRVIGRVHVVQPSESAARGTGQAAEQHTRAPYFTTKQVIIHEQHVKDFMKSFLVDEWQNLDNHANNSDENEGSQDIVVEEIHYTNECELSAHPPDAQNDDLRIALPHLATFSARFGTPASCAFLLEHMTCPSLTTLDLTVGCGTCGHVPSTLAAIADFVSRNGQSLRVLRIAVASMYEEELWEVLGSMNGASLKELYLAQTTKTMQRASFMGISNETLKRLTFGVSADSNTDHAGVSFPNLSRFSYVGHTRSLDLQSILDMLESRTRTKGVFSKRFSKDGQGVHVNFALSLKSTDKFAAGESDGSSVKGLQRLIDEGHVAELHIQAAGRHVIPANCSH